MPWEWALQVGSIAFSHYPSTQPSNDAAVLASSYEMISLQQDLWTDVKAFMTRNGFTCEMDYASGNEICGIAKSCDYLVNFMPTLELNFVGSDGNSSIYVPIPPEYYLQSADDD